jgi:hypothetical protein
MGFNNATVVGLATDVEFSFEPEFRTSSREVSLENFPEGIYTIAISSIASGNFGDNLEAEIELVDCGDRNDDGEFDDLPPCEERFFEDGDGSRCEGQYYVSFHQTGKTLPDGSCEILKVLQFDAALDCPFPEYPPKECSSTKQRDCSPLPLDTPTCVNTGSGDGFNSNAGYNAIVKVRTGRKTIEYLRPDKKECAEVCEFVEEAINVPSCEEPPRKPVPPPTCGYARRYIGWGKFDPSSGDYRDVLTGRSIFGSVGTAIVETFSCDDGTTFGLRAFTARCLPPSNRYIDDFAAANYQGNEFGEGCCPFDETKPPRPVCPPKLDKWKCVDGVCVQDANGVYASLAECQAVCAPATLKKWGISGQCSATFVNFPPASYLASFFVLSATEPVLVSVSIIDPNTSQPNSIYNFPGFNTIACDTPLVGFVVPDGTPGNQWLIATIQFNSQIFGVLISGARQQFPYISVSWSGSNFVICP